MSHSGGYKKGQWLTICDVCGFQFLSGKMKRRWDGLMVDDACFETRHEQEFIRGVKESTIPWSRPEPEGIDVSPFFYVEIGYWDQPSVVPPATFTTDKYVDIDLTVSI